MQKCEGKNGVFLFQQNLYNVWEEKGDRVVGLYRLFILRGNFYGFPVKQKTRFARKTLLREKWKGIYSTLWCLIK